LLFMNMTPEKYAARLLEMQRGKERGKE
jgi:hypothetical protein